MSSINDYCASFREKCIIFRILNENITDKLNILQTSIEKSLDLQDSVGRNRPKLRVGIDDELDKKILQLSDLSKTLTATGELMSHQFPHFMQEFVIVYIPEMGHVIVTKHLDESQADLEEYGLQFLFKTRGTFHYKHALCKELDKHLGGINCEIIAHENRIVERLKNYLVKYNQHIQQPLGLIALIDCLISMSKLAINFNYTKPILSENNVIQFKNSRHPLYAVCVDDFVINDYVSGTETNPSRLKIITGPNGSGKSIYLKQMALLTYLAHTGSYVPADSFTIGALDAIYSVVHECESISTQLSSFLVDLTHMGQVFHNASGKYLLTVDEFGKGTSGPDGFALLTAAIFKFINDGNRCPHVLVSTHFQELHKYLPETPLVEHLKMDFHFEDMPDGTKKLVHLYKAVPGISNSFSIEAAMSAGLDLDIIEDARHIYNSLYANQESSQEESDEDEDFYTTLNVPEFD